MAEQEAECQHDWRRDPFAPMLMSNPPLYKIVCANCEAVLWKRDLAYPPSKDPKDWPKVQGPKNLPK